MEKAPQIKGIKESEYPILYAMIKKNMIAYNMTKIRVKILRYGFNAGALSFFGDYLIVTKKLIETMDEEEIEAIVAHEFSHIFNRDIFVRRTIILLFSLPLLYAFYSIIHYRTNSINISAAQGIILFISLIISIYGIKVANSLSIPQEVRSDREAVLRTQNPEAMINALFKFYSEPFTRNKRPSYFEKIIESFEYLFFYFYGFTHPGSKERIEYLELAKKMLERTQVNGSRNKNV